MVRFWIRALANRFLKPRAPWLPNPFANAPDGSTAYYPTVPSQVVPAVPQYPINMFPRDGAVSDQVMLDSITVGRCILNVFSDWMDEGVLFPRRAVREVGDLYGRYEQLLGNVPRHLHSDIPIEAIEALAWQYVGELSRSLAFMRRFARDEVDVKGLTLDFASTIGCGPPLAALLDTRA